MPGDFLRQEPETGAKAFLPRLMHGHRGERLPQWEERRERDDGREVGRGPK